MTSEIFVERIKKQNKTKKKGEKKGKRGGRMEYVDKSLIRERSNVLVKSDAMGVRSF